MHGGEEGATTGACHGHAGGGVRLHQLVLPYRTASKAINQTQPTLVSLQPRRRTKVCTGNILCSTPKPGPHRLVYSLVAHSCQRATMQPVHVVCLYPYVHVACSESDTYHLAHNIASRSPRGSAELPTALPVVKTGYEAQPRTAGGGAAAPPSSLSTTKVALVALNNYLDTTRNALYKYNDSTYVQQASIFLVALLSFSFSLRVSCAPDLRSGHMSPWSWQEG